MARYCDLWWGELMPILNNGKIHILENKKIDKVEMHDHPFLELSYIVKGDVIHNRNGEKTVLRPGDYLIVDYGSVHSYVATEKEKGFENIDCVFLPELLDPVLKGTESLAALFENYLLHFNMNALSQDPANIIFHDEDGTILALLKKMQIENEAKKAGYIEMLRCCLIEILLYTIRNIDNALTASMGQDVISYMTEYVAKNYKEQIALQKIAEDVNYSISHISKMFKEKMGVTFIAYLQNYRILQSCRLLITTSKTVSEVSEMVGYSDDKSYSKIFKRITGMTPAAFRRQQPK